MAKQTRIPTETEIASALNYLDGEFTGHTYDGEQIAEALAFGRLLDMTAVRSVDPSYAVELTLSAQHMRGAFTTDQWLRLAARADYLRASEGSWSDPNGQHGTAPRYTEGK